MSRLEFRAPVDAPRPAAAWLLVATASATLWITRQLEPWAVGLGAGAILLSLHRRHAPFGWQRSGRVLNAGMVAIVAVTLVLAGRGRPALVAFAHFAALAQGLQLLDARPRRSEFLLVALALFQVLLASSLTDSLLFVPLLTAFVVSAAWTLIVHTLRSEALEAGVPGSLSRALTPGLLRTTLLASTASILLSGLLFVSLPRLHSGLGMGAGLGGEDPVGGFSDRVEIGDLGRIREDRTAVMWVETVEGEAPGPRDAYWRGLAFDRFDGRGWSITPRTRRVIARNAELGVTLGRHPGGERLQRILREPVASGVLFAAGPVWALQGALGPVQRDVNGGLYAPARSHQRVRYTALTGARIWSDAALARDRTRPPAEDGARYLALPPLDPAIGEIARRLVDGAESDAARLRALERGLRRSGRYTDALPPVDPRDGRSPVEAFLLGERAGHCEYFATAMVVLARSLGIPTRLVNGFAGGRRNRLGGFVEVTRADAHAWVEAHYERAGWVRYDPTPPDLRLRAAASSSWLDSLRSLGSAVELWWFQRIVDFDRSDQIRAMQGAWRLWRDFESGGGGEEAPSAGRRMPPGTRRLLGWAAVLALGGLGIALARRAVRRRLRRPALPPAYARALRVLERWGFVRGPAQTARAFAHEVERGIPAEGGHAFLTLTERYLEERFGGRTPAEARADAGRLLAVLRRARPPRR